MCTAETLSNQLTYPPQGPAAAQEDVCYLLRHRRAVLSTAKLKSNSVQRDGLVHKHKSFCS